MNAGNEWIDQARRALDALRAGVAPAEGASSDAHDSETHASDCRWCPVCQLAAVVRGDRPEVTAALADVLTATATALRAFAAESADATSPAASATDVDAADAADVPDGAAHSEGTGEPPVVQRIEIA